MSSVGIFWDFENCHPPSGMSGFTVAEKIKEVVRYLGSISVFKAYFDVNREAMKGVQQHELQCSGISLIHTPHTSGKKDVADKVLLVDLMIYALQGNEKKTIVLIAGDQDYSYAVSMLRSRGHDVFVITASLSTHHGLGRLASETLHWKEDVLMAGEGQSRRVFGQELSRETPSTRMRWKITQTSGGSLVLSKKLEEVHRITKEVEPGLESSAVCSKEERDDGTVKQPVRAPVSTGMKTLTSSDSTEVAQFEVTPDGFPSESVEGEPPPDLHHPSPDEFSALITVLQEGYSIGWTGMVFSTLKPLLEKADPRVYQSAGVAGFRQYIEAARDANIVYFFTFDWETESGYVFLRSPHVHYSRPIQVTETWERSEETTNVLPSVLPGSQQEIMQSPLAQPSLSRPVDPNFRVLVDEMRSLRFSLRHNITRCKLSPRLIKRDPKVAKRLGMNMKKYLSMAKQLGYIRKTGKAHLSLHPDYY